MTAVAVHPGAIVTELGQHLDADDIKVLTSRISERANSSGKAYKSIPAGAATSVWAATSVELAGHGGLYLEDCHIGEPEIAGTSFSLQVGLQFKVLMLLFMTDFELAKFRRRSKGWEAGVHGKIVLATVGAGSSIDSSTASKPIIGFVFSNKGLMYNLSLEGNKITRLKG